MSKQPPRQNVPTSDRSASDSQSRSEIIRLQSEYRGPLPHPEMLQQYERIHPGTAERILLRFEKEAEHRHAIEHKIIDAQIADAKDGKAESRRGQSFAFVIGLLGLLVGGTVALLSKSDAGAYAGAAIGGVTLVGLVTAFIVGRRIRPPHGRPEDEQSKE